MPIGDWNPAPKPKHNKIDKPKKINHNRGGLSQRQLGAITPKVRQEVRERSGGVCEVRICCDGAFATEQAHDQSRNTIDHRTTANDLLDSCNACHSYLDRTAEGMQLRRSINEMGGATEYIRRRKQREGAYRGIAK